MSQYPFDYDPKDFMIRDPEAFTKNLFRIIEEGSKAYQGVTKSLNGGLSAFSTAEEMAEASRMVSDVSQRWMTDPLKLFDAQTKLMTGYAEIWQSSIQRMMGQDADPVAEPEPGDNRFQDSEWTNNLYFDYWKQIYLLTSHWAEDILERTEGLDDAERHRAQFHLHQILSAFSPSNFPTTNPEVLRETLSSNAQNLADGITNFVRDLEKSDDLFKISQSDSSAFEVGRNLAVTPGKVVFQNNIIQLIQYTPTTGHVHRIPLLIVPPWINKFYILDLTQTKSFIKYIVDQGFTVFIISWVNPDERLADKTFEDYMMEGLLAAASAVRRETGDAQCNVLGYCVGGTLLAATLAYLAKRGEHPFTSATFLTTQIDFTRAGDLKVFIDERQMRSLEEMMLERGYLDGSRMANVFNMLRPRDLIWPYIINNYLLGKKPFPFDLLYWNEDSTRMPAANHNFYLREFYLENNLAKGQMSLGGLTLDVSRVTLPVYELAAREDHIAPAVSVLNGAKLFGGRVEYVLAGSGHIAGVINPPQHGGGKYQFWTNPHGLKSDTIETWLKGARETPGSWWGHWIEWLRKHSDDTIQARLPAQVLEPIEDAPGSYVRVRS